MLRQISPIFSVQVRMATAEDLSAEIAAFDEACSCNEEEIQARQQLLNDIGRIVDGIWGDKAAAKAFGSFATHTSAHNSDLDVVITGLLAPANDGGTQVCRDHGNPYYHPHPQSCCLPKLSKPTDT